MLIRLLVTGHQAVNLRSFKAEKAESEVSPKKVEPKAIQRRQTLTLAQKEIENAGFEF